MVGRPAINSRVSLEERIVVVYAHAREKTQPCFYKDDMLQKERDNYRELKILARLRALLASCVDGPEGSEDEDG